MRDFLKTLCEHLKERGFQSEIYASGRAVRFYILGEPWKLRVRFKSNNMIELSLGDNDYNLTRIKNDPLAASSCADYVQQSSRIIEAMIHASRKRIIGA